jgi:hypothetical protein
MLFIYQLMNSNSTVNTMKHIIEMITLNTHKSVYKEDQGQGKLNALLTPAADPSNHEHLPTLLFLS